MIVLYVSGFLILLLMVFFLIGNWIAKEDQLTKGADLAILFGALTPWKINQRINKAVELYQNKLVKGVIVTGGMNRIYRRLEAPWIKRKLIKTGVSNKNIYIESKATNYRENALFTLPIVKRLKVRSVVLISSSFEQLRCFLTIKKVFGKLEIRLINQPASSQPMWNKNTWFFHLSGWKWTWFTLSRLIKYRLKGDL